MNTVNILENFP